MKENVLEATTSAAVGDTRHIKYVFADIVRFSTNRSVEAQTDIVEALNAACTQAFENLIPGGEVIYIPTGDGICVAIIDSKAAFDAHIVFAIELLARLDEHNKTVLRSKERKEYMWHFEVRIGVSENVDTIVKDINGNKNVAGNGVTTAQRVMALADGMQILVASGAYQTLQAHEKYMDGFQRFKATVKHDQPLETYQFIRAGVVGLNTQTPLAFQNREPIEDQYEACLRDHMSTGGQVRCTMEAAEKWQAEVNYRLSELTKKLPENQRALLDKAHRAWSRYQKTELEFSAGFYSLMRGSMWRPIRAARHHDIVRERGRDLGAYLASIGEAELLGG